MAVMKRLGEMIEKKGDCGSSLPLLFFQVFGDVDPQFALTKEHTAEMDRKFTRQGIVHHTRDKRLQSDVPRLAELLKSGPIT
jgi:hypothetical protein